MSVGAGIIAGLIIGWIIEWIIDWRFWRVGSGEENQVDLHRLQEQLRKSQAEVARLRNELANTADSDLNELSVTQIGEDK